jgi:RNA polymerase sigma-70 factor (ECF subfamily)
LNLKSAGLMPPSSDQNRQSWEELLILVAEIQSHDAFAQLYRHFAPRLKSYLMRGGASDSLAEDVAQEAMATAWRKAALFDPAKANVSTWLFTIARNLRIDRIRRESRPEPDPNDPAFVPEPLPSPDRVITAQQNADIIQHALADLPDAQREAVMLSFFEEASHAAIAERLQVPLGTVKSRIRLGLRSLGQRVNRESYGVDP